MSTENEALHARLARVKLLALDVDGTLTDGGIVYDNAGNESRRFDIKDGLGMVLASMVGLKCVWITGRTAPLVERRARELNVALLLQGVRDKATALADVSVKLGIAPEEMAFLGDDLNDIPALQDAGIAMAVADAAPEVLAVSHWVSSKNGGHGAVRDAIEAILKARGDYDAARAVYTAALKAPNERRVQ